MSLDLHVILGRLRLAKVEGLGVEYDNTLVSHDATHEKHPCIVKNEFRDVSEYFQVYIR